MTPTMKHARRIVEAVDAGLVRGIGRPFSGAMCVEAVVANVVDGTFSDQPSCVSVTVAAYKIILNDEGVYESERSRGRALRRIAVAQLGSDGIDGTAFARAVLTRLAERLDRILSPNPGRGYYADAEAILRDSPAYYSPRAARRVADGFIRSSVDDSGTLAGIDAGIAALRELNCPGITFMDQLIQEGVL